MIECLFGGDKKEREGRDVQRAEHPDTCVQDGLANEVARYASFSKCWGEKTVCYITIPFKALGNENIICSIN